MYEFEPILARLKEAKLKSGLTNTELAARSGRILHKCGKKILNI